DRAEAQLLALADRFVVAEKIAGRELEILEVERRLPSLGRRVRVGEALEEVLQEGPIARSQPVEHRLLHALARLLVARGTLALPAEAAEVEQGVRVADIVETVEERGRVLALVRGRRRVVRETAGGEPELLDPLVERRGLAELEHELAAGRAERLVDPDQH